MKQIVKKLRSRAGETIAETLVALLVGTLALMVLAGMITATSNIIKTSESKMDDYYKECAKLATFETGGAGATGSGTAVITVGESTTVSVPVASYENNIFAGHTVTAYRMSTAPAGTDEGADGAGTDNPG